MSTLLEKARAIKQDKDTNLLPGNLKSGVTCLGVSGTYSGIDTSDADATASDILQGKTAYVDGQKLTGNYIPLDTSDANATASDIMQGKTAYVNGVKITGTNQGGGASTVTITKNTTISIDSATLLNVLEESLTQEQKSNLYIAAGSSNESKAIELAEGLGGTSLYINFNEYGLSIIARFPSSDDEYTDSYVIGTFDVTSSMSEDYVDYSTLYSILTSSTAEHLSVVYDGDVPIVLYDTSVLTVYNSGPMENHIYKLSQSEQVLTIITTTNVTIGHNSIVSVDCAGIAQVLDASLSQEQKEMGIYKQGTDLYECLTLASKGAEKLYLLVEADGVLKLALAHYEGSSGTLSTDIIDTYDIPSFDSIGSDEFTVGEFIEALSKATLKGSYTGSDITLGDANVLILLLEPGDRIKVGNTSNNVQIESMSATIESGDYVTINTSDMASVIGSNITFEQDDLYVYTSITALFEVLTFAKGNDYELALTIDEGTANIILTDLTGSEPEVTTLASFDIPSFESPNGITVRELRNEILPKIRIAFEYTGENALVFDDANTIYLNIYDGSDTGTLEVVTMLNEDTNFDVGEVPPVPVGVTISNGDNVSVDTSGILSALESVVTQEQLDYVLYEPSTDYYRFLILATGNDVKLTIAANDGIAYLVLLKLNNSGYVTESINLSSGDIGSYEGDLTIRSLLGFLPGLNLDFTYEETDPITLLDVNSIKLEATEFPDTPSSKIVINTTNTNANVEVV